MARGQQDSRFSVREAGCRHHRQIHPRGRHDNGCEGGSDERQGHQGKQVNRTFAVLVVGCLAFAACGRKQNILVVTNNSGVTAQQVTVKVCGKDYIFTGLTNGGSKTQSFSVDSDSGFLVSASLADGTTLTNGFGYVTGGAGAHGNSAEIEITQRRQIVGKQK